MVSPLEGVDWDDVDRCMGDSFEFVATCVGFPSDPKDSVCTGVKDAPEVREAEAALMQQLNSAQIAMRFDLAQENQGLQESSSLLLPKAPHTNEFEFVATYRHLLHVDTLDERTIEQVIVGGNGLQELPHTSPSKVAQEAGGENLNRFSADDQVIKTIWITNEFLSNLLLGQLSQRIPKNEHASAQLYHYDHAVMEDPFSCNLFADEQAALFGNARAAYTGSILEIVEEEETISTPRWQTLSDSEFSWTPEILIAELEFKVTIPEYLFLAFFYLQCKLLKLNFIYILKGEDAGGICSQGQDSLLDKEQGDRAIKGTRAQSQDSEFYHS